MSVVFNVWTGKNFDEFGHFIPTACVGYVPHVSCNIEVITTICGACFEQLKEDFSTRNMHVQRTCIPLHTIVDLMVDAVAGSSTMAEAISETRPECAVPALFTKMSTANSQTGQIACEFAAVHEHGQAYNQINIRRRYSSP